MENISEATLPSKKLWSNYHLMFGSALGGTLTGFYLLSTNYKAMGYVSLAKKTLRAGVASFLFFLLCLVFIPDAEVDHSLPFLFLTQPLLAGSYMIFEHYKAFYQKNLSKKFFPILFQLFCFS